ncbi:anaphase-promoting complex subunit 7 [Contarinia nasturtii]|uniref:anaphase-promoting complex subunit 7 n=1 Tax=Contarinia nasturtii TaxID=265458 RepID=UPI0012D4B67C|nr:anaphase-promoting complex subunit 7 [Contarinia nasturtii]
MDSFFVQLKKLSDYKLYGQALQIALVLEADYEKDRSLLIPEQYFLLQIYIAQSYNHRKQYRKAAQIYRNALIARKQIVKGKSAMAMNYENLIEMYPENEIRYQIALSLEQVNEFQEALSALNGISNRQRNLTINMMIGKLSMQNGKCQNAVTAFEAVLRECPMALDAIKELLTLGVTELEISNIISETSLPIQVVDWINTYLDASAAMKKCKFTEAISFLETIESKPQFGNNELITVMLGQCYYLNGDHDTALTHFQRAYSANNDCLDVLNMMGAIYAKKGDSTELEKLTQLFVNAAEYTSEHWLIYGYHYYVMKKFEKSSYFAHKACYLNPRNIEACLLKARVFLELKKYDEALIQLRLLIQYANNRFEVHECLVHAYIGMSRWREAQLQANEAYRILGKSPRNYVLGAQTYIAGNTLAARSKAKPYLEKALKLNKNYQPAILFLVTLLVEEGNTSKAIQLLRKLAAVRPSPEIYSKIGDIYAERQERKEAIECYTEALHLDPLNRRALSQLEVLEKQSNKDDEAGPSNIGNNDDDNSDMMDVQTDATDAGGEEGDVVPLPGEIESETLWSDTDQEVLQPYQD